MAEPAATETTETTDTATDTTTDQTTTTTDTVVPFKWSDGWREELAGGDEKKLKELNEFTNPTDIWNGYKSLRSQRDSGEYKRALPDNPTDDELAAHRKSIGIPEYEKYQLDTTKVADDMDDGMTSFVEAMRKSTYDLNLPADKAQMLFDNLLGSRQESIDANAEKDELDKTKGEDELRNQYGKDYRINMNLSSALLDGENPEFKESLLNSRLPDGTLFKNSPMAQDFLVRTARQINPVDAIMPQGASDPASIQDEINKIAALRRTDRKQYDSAPVQERLNKLVAARDGNK